MLYSANSIGKHGAYTQKGLARPINYKVDTIIERFIHAWGVLIGKYDALDWQEKSNQRRIK